LVGVVGALIGLGTFAALRGGGGGLTESVSGTPVPPAVESVGRAIPQVLEAATEAATLSEVPALADRQLPPIAERLRNPVRVPQGVELERSSPKLMFGDSKRPENEQPTEEQWAAEAYVDPEWFPEGAEPAAQ
jgi:hypothetical protein